MSSNLSNAENVESAEAVAAAENGANSNSSNENSSDQRLMYTPVKTRSYVNRNYNSKSVDFNAMTREELVVEATRLQRHCFQLKNLLLKCNSNPALLEELNIAQSEKKDKRKTWKERPFDHNKYNKRHLYIKFAYFGWNYQVSDI